MSAKQILMATAGAQAAPVFIEDVFSATTYAGNGSGQTITNGAPLGSTAEFWGVKYRENSSSGYGITTDSSGSVYVTGMAADGVSDYGFIAKYNTSGTLQWHRKFRQGFSFGNGITTDSSGDVYVTGSANDGSAYAFIAKYNTSGTLQWHRKFRQNTSIGRGISTDSSGSVYVTGRANDGSNYAFIAKYNTSGALQWQRKFRESGSFGNGITTDSSGDVYVTGVASDGNDYAFIAKYNTSGTLQWQRKFRQSGSLGYGISTDSSGAVYVTGFASDGNAYPFIAKYNTSGALQWQRKFRQGFSYGHGISTDSSGNVYVTGFASGGGDYAFIAKYNASGTLQWQRRFRENTSYGYGISVDSSGNVYATGFANDGSNYAFILKLAQDGSTTSGTVNNGTLANGTATDSAGTATDSPGTATDSSGSATDSAGTATDSAGTATSTTSTQAAVVGKGGLTILKGRSGATDWAVYDTTRGATFDLATNTTAAQTTQPTGLTGFNANGFSIGALAKINASAATYASWTFCKQPKFCDVVTWVKGSNTNNRIPHALGSTPGCIIMKSVQPNSSQWFVWHRSLPDPLRSYLLLNDPGGTSTAGSDFWGASAPTAADFGVNDPAFGASGEQWVAIVFAHDAGGFGPLGADHVISCGAFTTDVSGIATVNLGYEPQFLVTKVVSAADNWMMMDQLRGFPATDSYSRLVPNLPNAEGTGIPGYSISPTGFTVAQGNGPFTYIYIAIRRGPMRVPTDPTTVFGMSANSSAIDASNPVVLTPAASDVWMNTRRDGSTGKFWLPRLAGWNYLNSTSTGSEQGGYTWDQRTSSSLRPSSSWWPSGLSQINYFWRRAPGFCDALIWTGNGADRDVPHNLRAVPELIIHKNRDLATNWVIYSAPTGPSALLKLNTNEASEAAGAVWWRNMSPIESTFPIGSGGNTLNGPAFRYLSLLFASCPGVSKVGSYTGTGAALQVNCGFAAGARFVLIKRINGAGDWHVWDSVRGIVASTDPYLLLNLMDAEVTTTDWIDPLASGFELSSAGGNNVNISGATYLYYAIA